MEESIGTDFEASRPNATKGDSRFMPDFLYDLSHSLPSLSASSDPDVHAPFIQRNLQPPVQVHLPRLFAHANLVEFFQKMAHPNARRQGPLPNRRGQPLVHRWYASRFEDSELKRVEPFEALLEATRLGREPLPNRGDAVDTDALATLLPAAIDAIHQRVRADLDGFRKQLEPRLDEEIDRLARLEEAQLGFIQSQFADRKDSRADRQRQARERRVRRLFSDYVDWFNDSMTTADEPFLQVIAVLVGAAP